MSAARSTRSSTEWSSADADLPGIGKLKWKIAHPNDGEPTDAQLNRAKALGIGWSLTFSGVQDRRRRPAVQVPR